MRREGQDGVAHGVAAEESGESRVHSPEVIVEDQREDVVPAHEFEQPEPKRKNVNERKHLRLQAKGMKACIRVAGRDDDVVDVINYSRGGLRFASFQAYQAGDSIEVATDYAPSAVNIFQKAEIVGMYQRPWGTFAGEYGAHFLK